jgi:hypothetical protein
MERHDAEATRAQGTCVHAPSKEQKIMVGSIDDPIILSLLNVRVRSPCPRQGPRTRDWVSTLNRLKGSFGDKVSGGKSSLGAGSK